MRFPALIVFLVSTVGVPASGETCDEVREILQDEYEWSSGCMLEIGRFPLSRPDIAEFSFDREVSIAHIVGQFGEPGLRDSVVTHAIVDRDVHLQAVFLEYAEFAFRLGCNTAAKACGLQRYVTTDTTTDIGCGLRVGQPLDKFLRALKVELSARQNRDAARGAFTLPWHQLTCHDDQPNLAHGGIVLFLKDRTISKIAWVYYED